MRNAILEERNFITPKEFSAVLDGQISVTTINLLIKGGKIPCAKLGRKNLIPVWFAKEQLTKGAEGTYGTFTPPTGDGKL